MFKDIVWSVFELGSDNRCWYWSYFKLNAYSANNGIVDNPTVFSRSCNLHDHLCIMCVHVCTKSINLRVFSRAATCMFTWMFFSFRNANIYSTKNKFEKFIKEIKNTPKLRVRVYSTWLSKHFINSVVSFE